MKAALGLLLLALGCTGVPAEGRPETPTAAPIPLPPTRALNATWVGEGEGPVVVLLHGWGGDGQDLLPIANRLHTRLGGAVRFALLEAPLVRPSGGRAWWHLELGRERPADRGEDRPDGLEEARRDVRAWMSMAEGGRPLDPARTVVAGFSQGGMLATEVGLHAHPPIAGIAILSGGPIDERNWRRIMAAGSVEHVFISHGRFDGILSFEASNRLADELEAAGSHVVRAPFDGAHEIPETVVEALADYLRATLVR